ncbi:MAG: hypothetical protein ACI8XZ_004191 [Gammaproteobacteria bacterium]|jgi:hypothetical protein
MFEPGGRELESLWARQIIQTKLSIHGFVGFRSKKMVRKFRRQIEFDSSIKLRNSAPE